MMMTAPILPDDYGFDPLNNCVGDTFGALEAQLIAAREFRSPGFMVLDNDLITDTVRNMVAMGWFRLCPKHPGHYLSAAMRGCYSRGGQ